MFKPHMREETLAFFHTLPKAFYPHAYIELKHRTFRESVRFLSSVVLIAYFVMIAIAAPKLVYLSSYLDGQFTKFDKFNIQLDIKMSEPIVVTEKEPMIVLTNIGDDAANITYNKLLITGEKIYFKESFSKIKEINYKEYLDVLGKKESIRKILVAGFYLMIPTAVFLLYVLSFFKYAVLALFTGILGYLISRLVRYEISPRESIVTAFYSATLMVFLEVATFPLQISSYLLKIPVYAGISIAVVPLAVFFTIYIISMIIISGKIVMH